MAAAYESAIPENLALLHRGEEELRLKAFEILAQSERLQLHVALVETAMDLADTFLSRAGALRGDMARRDGGRGGASGASATGRRDAPATARGFPRIAGPSPSRRQARARCARAAERRFPASSATGAEARQGRALRRPGKIVGFALHAEQRIGRRGQRPIWTASTAHLRFQPARRVSSRPTGGGYRLAHSPRAGRAGEAAQLEICPQPRRARQAATTCWVCFPRPATPNSTTSPGFSHTGSGLMPMPTPGGVPVAMRSPGSSVM